MGLRVRQWGNDGIGGFARYPWIRVAADFMGSGYFTSLAHSLFPPRDAGREISQQAFERRLAPLADYELTHQLEKLLSGHYLFGTVRLMMSFQRRKVHVWYRHYEPVGVIII